MAVIVAVMDTAANAVAPNVAAPAQAARVVKMRISKTPIEILRTASQRARAKPLAQPKAKLRTETGGVSQSEIGEAAPSPLRSRRKGRGAAGSQKTLDAVKAEGAEDVNGVGEAPEHKADERYGYDGERQSGEAETDRAVGMFGRGRAGRHDDLAMAARRVGLADDLGKLLAPSVKSSAGCGPPWQHCGQKQDAQRPNHGRDAFAYVRSSPHAYEYS